VETVPVIALTPAPVVQPMTATPVPPSPPTATIVVEREFNTVLDTANSGIGSFQENGRTMNFKNCSPGDITITKHVASRVEDGAEIIQIRAYKTSSNYSNGVSDYVSFNGTTPTLMIKYR